MRLGSRSVSDDLAGPSGEAVDFAVNDLPRTKGYACDRARHVLGCKRRERGVLNHLDSPKSTGTSGSDGKPVTCLESV